MPAAQRKQWPTAPAACACPSAGKQLADLNGDGIPDLVVANSGGNDVLVFPGLPNGHTRPTSAGMQARLPTGTDPVGITVANLNGRPDLA